MQQQAEVAQPARLRCAVFLSALAGDFFLVHSRALRSTCLIALTVMPCRWPSE